MRYCPSEPDSVMRPSSGIQISTAAITAPEVSVTRPSRVPTSAAGSPCAASGSSSESAGPARPGPSRRTAATVSSRQDITRPPRCGSRCGVLPAQSHLPCLHSARRVENIEVDASRSLAEAVGASVPLAQVLAARQWTRLQRTHAPAFDVENRELHPGRLLQAETYR